jgi:hypothetical protein
MASDSQRVFDWFGSGYFGDDSGFDIQKTTKKVLTDFDRAGLVITQKILF